MGAACFSPFFWRLPDHGPRLGRYRSITCTTGEQNEYGNEYDMYAKVMQSETEYASVGESDEIEMIENNAEFGVNDEERGPPAWGSNVGETDEIKILIENNAEFGGNDAIVVAAAAAGVMRGAITGLCLYSMGS